MSGIFLLLVLAGCRQSAGEQAKAAAGPTLRTSYAGAVPPGAVKRLGKGTLNVVAFSPDGSQIAAGGDTGLTLYSASTFDEGWALPTTTPVISLAFSPNNDWLAAGGLNGTIHLIDVETGQIVEATPAFENDFNGVYSLAWSSVPDTAGDFFLAAGFNDGNVAISQITTQASPNDETFDIQTTSLFDRLPGGVTALVFDPKGDLLAIGDRTGRISLWDAQTFQQLGSYDGHQDDQAIRDLAWSPDGEHLLSSGRDGRLIEWDVLTFEPIREYTRLAETFGVTYLPSDTIALADESGLVSFWPKDGEESDGRLAGVGVELADAAWSLDGDLMAVVATNGELSLWPTQDGTLAAAPSLILAGYSKAGQASGAAAWSPDGQELAAGLGTEVIIWDVASGEREKVLTGHTSQVNDLVWSPEGDRLASSSRDQTTIIWDSASGEPLQRLADHNSNVTDLAWSPDGRFLASAGSLDNTAVIWDVESGAVHQTLSTDEPGIWSVAWSPDGNILATGTTGGNILFWDLTSDSTASPVTILRRHLDWVAGLDFSPDGALLASVGADNRLVLTTLADNKARTIGSHFGPIRRVHFSPDGARLATTGRDGLVIVWPAAIDAVTDPLAVFAAQSDAMNDVVWSPDGSSLAAASDDGTIIIWDGLPDDQ